jgi:ATP-dependent DNA helicase HFM1/MER3
MLLSTRLPIVSPTWRRTQSSGTFLGLCEVCREPFLIPCTLSHSTKAVVEVAIVKHNGPQLKHGLEVYVLRLAYFCTFDNLTHFSLRCLTAKAWEDRPVVLKQIEQIGERS